MLPYPPRKSYGRLDINSGSRLVRLASCQAVEKGSPASLRSIASLQRISKYASSLS